MLLILLFRHESKVDRLKSVCVQAAEELGPVHISRFVSLEVISDNPPESYCDIRYIESNGVVHMWTERRKSNKTTMVMGSFRRILHRRCQNNSVLTG
ncbi:hypothetical protein AVEN_113075-1 [Araneus ventricosus]|uniref:Uncharacterized protein n=1 Tax=Araneus ventricosus TaxID=182803 RepID=A0A4Y2ISD0_ARAVE|nr:hypothetical protein AVEN_113075-1 [Araneus ventricosus]